MDDAAHPSARRWQVVITTEHPARTARFWCRALGYVPQPPPDGHATWDAYAEANGMTLRHGTDIDAAVDPAGVGPRLLFVRDDPAVRGSISIEVLTGADGPDRDALDRVRADLVAEGARVVHVDSHDDHPWAQLLSPDNHPLRLI